MTLTSPAVLATPQRLRDALASLLLYQNVLQQPEIAALITLLDTLEQGKPRACLEAYGQWFRQLAARRLSARQLSHKQADPPGQTDPLDWADMVLEAVLLDDNPFSQQVQQFRPIQTTDADALQFCAEEQLQAVRRDLQILYGLACLSSVHLNKWMKQVSSKPDSDSDSEPEPNAASEAMTEPIIPPAALRKQTSGLQQADRGMLDLQQDWSTQLEAIAQHYQQRGTGLFGRFWALRWQGSLEGIATPDPITLDQLVGYEDSKQQLLRNTERLVRGQPALHVLLYGSRGTGKSSLVKALVHQYGNQGLRLVELPKAHLIDLPQLVEHLRHQPHSFVIFVDDLSFEADDESFKALKVVLEGSVTARAENVVVYATSNRRHLIREFHQDRPHLRSSDRHSLHRSLDSNQQEEIHAWDTVQEKLSFSDRFGLTLTFVPPQQETYLTIVRHLAHRYGISLPTEELEFQARRWATRNNGQSGRSARQFIDWLRGESAEVQQILNKD